MNRHKPCWRKGEIKASSVLWQGENEAKNINLINPKNGDIKAINIIISDEVEWRNCSLVSAIKRRNQRHENKYQCC